MANLKSPATIKRHLKQLRKEVIESKDPIESRIAYAMECAVRWATERTVGWPSLADIARMDAKTLRDALARQSAVRQGEGGGE